jgi:hypothetical protein
VHELEHDAPLPEPPREDEDAALTQDPIGALALLDASPPGSPQG